jgi:hypothetical protein
VPRGHRHRLHAHGNGEERARVHRVGDIPIRRDATTYKIQIGLPNPDGCSKTWLLLT